MSIEQQIETDAPAAMPRRPSLVISALSNWAALATTLAMGLVLTPFIISRLGQAGHGIWVLVGTILWPLGLLELGVPAAVTRYVALYAARREYGSLSRTVSSAMMFFLIAAGVIAAVSVIGAKPLAAFFKVPADQAGGFQTAVVLLGCALGANLVGQVFRAVMQGHEQFLVRNGINIGSQVIRAALTIGLLLADWGLVGVAVASLVADAAVFVACLIYVRRKFPAARFRPRLASRRDLWPLLTFGLTSFVIAGADMLRGQFGMIVAGRMIDLQAVSVYGVGFMLLQYYGKVIFSGFGVLTPRLSALAGLNDAVGSRALMLKSMWVCSLLSGLGALLLLALGGPFIHAWIRRGGYDAAATVLTISLCAGYFEVSQYPAIQALYAHNRHRFLAAVRLVEAGCNVILSILLAPRLGVVGIAIALAAPMAVSNLLIQPTYISRMVGLPLRQFMGPSLTCAAGVAALYFAWTHLAAWRMTSPSLATVAVLAVVLSAAYLASAAAAYAGRRRMAVLFSSSPVATEVSP